MPAETCHNCLRAEATPEDTDDSLCYARFGDAENQLDCAQKTIQRLRLRDAAAAPQPYLYGPGGTALFTTNIMVNPEAEYRRKVRDQFAAHALQGILADASAGGVDHDDTVARYKVAMQARQYADALMAALDYGASKEEG